MCDSIDERRPEQADPQGQRVGSWLSGGGEGDGASFWGDRMSWN